MDKLAIQSTIHTPKRGIDYVGITCVFFCHDGNGKFLMHKRSKNCRDEQGMWDVGAGALEHGESLDNAVKREIYEEYCSQVKDLLFLDVINVIRNHETALSHWLALVFAAHVYPDQVKIGEPHKMDDIGWFTFDSLPEPRHSFFPSLHKILQEKGFA